MGRLSEYDDDDLARMGLKLLSDGETPQSVKEPYEKPVLTELRSIEEFANRQAQLNEDRLTNWLARHARFEEPPTEPMASMMPLFDETGDHEDTVANHGGTTAEVRS